MDSATQRFLIDSGVLLSFAVLGVLVLVIKAISDAWSH